MPTLNGLEIPGARPPLLRDRRDDQTATVPTAEGAGSSSNRAWLKPFWLRLDNGNGDYYVISIIVLLKIYYDLESMVLGSFDFFFEFLFVWRKFKFGNDLICALIPAMNSFVYDVGLTRLDSRNVADHPIYVLKEPSQLSDCRGRQACRFKNGFRGPGGDLECSRIWQNRHCFPLYLALVANATDTYRARASTASQACEEQPGS